MKSLITLFCLLFAIQFATATTTLSETPQSKEVPEAVMRKFRSSFIIIENSLHGAKIDMLKPYLTNDEISALMISTIQDKWPQHNKFSLFLGYKPKSGACKKSPKWVCVVHDVGEE